MIGGRDQKENLSNIGVVHFAVQRPAAERCGSIDIDANILSAPALALN